MPKMSKKLQGKQPCIEKFYKKKYNEKSANYSNDVPRYFFRDAHWVRNPNHPATAAGGVGPPPLPPRASCHNPIASQQAHRRMPRRRRDSWATRPRSPEFQYETLLMIERATLGFFQKKKDAIMLRMTGNSKDSPGIMLSDDEDKDEDEDLPVNRILKY